MTSRNIYQSIIPFIRKPGRIENVAVTYVIVFFWIYYEIVFGIINDEINDRMNYGRNKKTAA
ncbi:hypothetical protein [Burkholderia contaminans]|uniref:Uncharacterized protein n=1 Tax=Burkholderia contaminans TaxID=488447 RepID=A0A6P2XGM0_9BURK|nr:hypothetical protein [Burkholderia contaminans]VWD08464.1 hypothetical protein BCO71171_02323 [Burkholderia contaminans]